MEEKIKLKSLRDLTFLRIGNSYWVECKELASFLKTETKENEPHIKLGNLIRDLNTYKTGISVLNGKRIVCASAVLRYMLKLSDKYVICNKVLSEIVGLLFGCSKESLGHLELYTKIAGLELWCEEQLLDIEIKDCNTIYKDYKNKFSPSEWKKICYFEYHFEKGHKSILDYGKEILAKYNFLDTIIMSQKIAQGSQKKCEETIVNNAHRKMVAEAFNGQNCFHNDTTHSYVMIDKSLNDCLEKYANIRGQCVCISCNNSCNHQGDVHVVVELKNHATESLIDIADLLATELNSVHSLKSEQYVFVQDGTLERFRCKFCENGETHRFQLQLDLYSNQHDFVVGTAVTQLQDYNDSEIFEQVPNLKLCANCFNYITPAIDDPLDWRSMDIMSEWLHHVPIEVQIFFSTWFINKRSVKRSMDQPLFLKGKLTRLYGLFDSGLSMLNKKYSGVIQQLNSEELLVNYHSLVTVFDTTSNLGCTQSLRTAERWLKRASDPSVSYYETYIKRYPLVYQSYNETEASTHAVSLQDCYLVFFMDNLVRLSTHVDPDPGNGRTSSICTLPITLKGLPRDSKVTESWHLDECTDLSGSCNCMNPIDLSTEDYNLLIHCTSAESHAWDNFQHQLNWSLLKQCVEKEVLSEALHLSTENVSVARKNRKGASGLEKHQDEKSPIEDTEIDAKSTNQSLSIFDDIGIQNLESEFVESMNLNETIDENQFIEGLCAESEQSNILQSTLIESTNYQELEDQQPKENEAQAQLEFTVPPLLCRHPIPATGRDDCKANVRLVLDETLLKLDRRPSQKDRILFAPDHKISNNVIKLMKENKKYQQFLLEFPVLHLRKSKIVNLFSAYEKAGLNHMLQFMKDSEQEADWRKLITLQNIETATRNVKRMSLALHLALFSKFYATLSDHNQSSLIADLHSMSSTDLSKKWDRTFSKFCEKGCNSNATFALHHNILNHCDEIVAISFAERIGGPDGYNLLLSAIKKSLPFAFLNGSSSYAAFCVELLHEHYRAGHFHRNMKMTLFSTPHKNSQINVALDTQREMDHKDAIKAFRPRSNLESVVPRMTVVDHFMDVHRVRTDLFRPGRDDTFDEFCKDTRWEKSNETSSQESVNETFLNNQRQVKLTEKDWKHCLPLLRMLERQKAFSLEDSLIPENIYASNDSNHFLGCEVLDSNSYSIGRFLIKKYAASNNLFGLEQKDLPDMQDVEGPRSLVRKAFGKGTTLRRFNNNPNHNKQMNSIDRAEKKRQSKVKKQTKVYNCLSSEMNTCQALLNPDGSKPPVAKASGIKKALCVAIRSLNSPESNKNETTFIKEGIDKIAGDIVSSITHATIEFAGIKFRTKAASGHEYIQHIENGILKKTMDNFPNVNTIVICEEKYSFTPDDFKFATRVKRNIKESMSIAHLKSGDEILCEKKMSKSAIIGTTEGKKLISNYLARNLTKLDIRQNLKLVIDSELLIQCERKCKNSETCCHERYALPVQCSFNREGISQPEILKIHQRKGEAEMSQVDWLSTIQPELTQKCAAISIVSSGDIDSVLIHMVTLSLHWPRFENGSFQNPVYVMLQKVKPDIYCITDLIMFFERMMGFRLAGLYIAIVCLLGGNDFIPRYHDKTHDKWMAVFLKDRHLLMSLLIIKETNELDVPTKIEIDETIYVQALKILYARKMDNLDELTLEEVRQFTIKAPGKDFRIPTQWMPPLTAVKSMIKLLNLHIEYMLTAWYHDAKLPVFLGKGCLIKDSETGCVKYDFGSDVRVSDTSELIQVNEDNLAKKMRIRVPNHKRNNDTRTPQKDDAPSKRLAQRSTPKKMRKPKCSKSLQLQPSEDH